MRGRGARAMALTCRAGRPGYCRGDPHPPGWVTLPGTTTRCAAVRATSWAARQNARRGRMRCYGKIQASNPERCIMSQRRSLRLPSLDFISTKSSLRSTPSRFDVTGGEGQVVVRGELSAGRVGWSLSGRVRRHRRMLHLWVTARQVDATDGWEVEDHRYVATLGDLPPGRYRLRVSHVYIPWGQENDYPIPEVFDQTVMVAGESIGLSPQ